VFVVICSQLSSSGFLLEEPEEEGLTAVRYIEALKVRELSINQKEDIAPAIDLFSLHGLLIKKDLRFSVPQGTSENSPAIHCRERLFFFRPIGTIEYAVFSSVPTERDIRLDPFPAIN
jgi:hypothetical protein